MSVFRDILAIAHEQSAALARGDLDVAVRLLDDRQRLVDEAGPASLEDAEVIHEILRRDRQLSTAIRERMLDLRDRAARSRHGQLALSGYYTETGRSPRLVDSRR